MLRYAGRAIEGTSPWEVGVGDFKTLIIILRDRAEAEIIFLRPRTSWRRSRALLRRQSKNPLVKPHDFTHSCAWTGVGVGRRRRHGACRGVTAEHGVLPEALLRRSVVAVRLVRASGGYNPYQTGLRSLAYLWAYPPKVS